MAQYQVVNRTALIPTCTQPTRQMRAVRLEELLEKERISTRPTVKLPAVKA